LTPAKKYGNSKAGSWRLGAWAVPRGSLIMLLFEHQCTIWQASASWTGTDLVRPAKQILVMSSGGEPTGPPIVAPTEEPVVPSPTPGGGHSSLPCKIVLDTSTKLVSGKAGFKILVKCTRTVESSSLAFKGATGSKEYRDKLYGTVEKGATWKLFTQAVEIFAGYTFTFSAVVDGHRASVSATLASPSVPSSTALPTFSSPLLPPLPTPPPIVPALPCKLTLDTDVTVSGGQPGFKVIVRCSQTVHEGTLSFTGPPGSKRYSKKAFGDIEPDVSWKLFVQRVATFKDYVFTFSGKNAGLEASISKRLTVSIAGPTMRPPRTTSVPVTESCAVYCDSKRPSKYCDKSYILYRKCKGCSFCARGGGARPSPNPAPSIPVTRLPLTPSPSTPMTSTPEPMGGMCKSFCDVGLKRVYCKPDDFWKSRCGGCSFCRGFAS